MKANPVTIHCPRCKWTVNVPGGWEARTVSKAHAAKTGHKVTIQPKEPA